MAGGDMAEVARLISELRADFRQDLGAFRTEVREDFRAVNARIDQLVPTAVHDADKTHILERVRGLEADMTDQRTDTATGRRWRIGLTISVACALIPALIAAVWRSS